VASAAVALGITLKLKGKIDNRVETVASPSALKMSMIISRNVYLSKIIKILCPIIVKTNVVVRIGSHRLMAWVKNGYLVQVVKPPTVAE
jgi:hypothetical protein